jgi:uncharacterized protein
MMTAQTIPLFPLGSVLLPRGRMPLQIFEPRYLDMISECMKTDTGFGVVWLSQGREVISASPAPAVKNKFSSLGTYAKIVDWDSLPNGLLGITIEGEKKFRLLSSQQKPNQQYIADIEWLEDEPLVALPREAQELQALLKQLLEHPHVARLNISADITDVTHLACLLTQLLPIAERIKFDLLSMTDPMHRLEQLVELLDNLSH